MAKAKGTAKRKRPTYDVTNDQATYRTVSGFPGYVVGDDGSVWSCRQFAEWCRLRPAPTSEDSPHLAVKLYPGRKSRLVHHLVLEAFVGPCPQGMECCHWDGDHQNNRLSNLRWDTRKANMEDMVRHGTRPIGERTSKAKLTAEKVSAIRGILQTGISLKRIGNMFGVSDTAVANIKLHKTWRHVL